MAREQKGQGAKGPGSELAWVLLADSLLGANWPGAKRLGTLGCSVIVCPLTIWIKWLKWDAMVQKAVPPARRIQGKRSIC